MKKLNKTELREKLQKGIREMEKILDSDDSTPNQKTYAANTMKNLVDLYNEKFNVAPEEGEGGVRSTSKNVSGWNG